MSLTLEDLKAEIDEYHNRIEEVLSGMSTVIDRLERRVATLEGQLASVAAAFSEEPELITPHRTIRK